MADRLADGLAALGFPHDTVTALAPEMDAYIKELQLFNSAYNLVNTGDRDELAVRHILDSLAPWKILESLVPAGASCADIGSGGGLPGIPLAAAFPDRRFTLVERMDKRCAFLENCAAVLHLSNITVMQSEAERIPAESFDAAVFRAFRPLDRRMTKTLLALVKNGGYLAAYKAKISSITEEMNSVQDIVKEYKIEKLNVPYLEDTERNLVLIRKNSY